MGRAESEGQQDLAANILGFAKPQVSHSLRDPVLSLEQHLWSSATAFFTVAPRIVPNHPIFFRSILATRRAVLTP